MPKRPLSAVAVPAEGAVGSSRLPGFLKLAEECSELAQILNKVVQHPTAGMSETNAATELLKRVREELADVEAAIQYVRWANDSIKLSSDDRVGAKVRGHIRKHRNRCVR